jgi:hypothetical protein
VQQGTARDATVLQGSADAGGIRAEAERPHQKGHSGCGRRRAGSVGEDAVEGSAGLVELSDGLGALLLGGGEAELVHDPHQLRDALVESGSCCRENARGSVHPGARQFTMANASISTSISSRGSPVKTVVRLGSTPLGTFACTKAP